MSITVDQYKEGDEIVLTVTVTDKDGAPASADLLKIVVHKTDETNPFYVSDLATGDVTSEGGGVYQVICPSTWEAGFYKYEWHGSGTADFAVPLKAGRFRIHPALAEA